MDIKVIALSTILVVLLYLIFSHHGKNVFENFDEDIYSKINRGLNTILACEKDHKSCDPSNKNIVRDFPSFKRVFNWPKFNVLLYMKLMKLRREKGSNLTNAEIDKIINDGKYQESFYTPPAQVSPPKAAPPKAEPAKATPATPSTGANVQKQKATPPIKTAPAGLVKK